MALDGIQAVFNIDLSHFGSNQMASCESEPEPEPVGARACRVGRSQSRSGWPEPEPEPEPGRWGAGELVGWWRMYRAGELIIRNNDEMPRYDVDAEDVD